MNDPPEKPSPFAPPFRAEVQIDDSVALVSVFGEIDIATSAQFEHELRVAWQSAGRRGNLIIDLQGVGFMDSSGLGVLARIRETVRPSGGEITLVRPQGPVRRVFEIAGLDKIVDVVDALPQSLAD